MSSPLNAIDFYKVSHKNMYPEGTEYVYSNLTPRSSKYFRCSDFYDNKVVNFGYQGFVKEWLIDEWNENFFKQPKDKVVNEYRRRLTNALGPAAAADLSHVEALHDLGYLPLLIKALPEGTRSNIGVPVLTVVNTDPRFFWLTNYIETHLSAYLWQMITNATTAYEYRRIFEKYYEETGADKNFIPFAGHDFAYRGLSTDSGRTQAGHLVSFVGTDTVPAIDYVEKYYNANSDTELVGCSVPASEHSCMTAYGPENEQELFRRLIEDLYPSGIVSIVSDSFDYWKVLTEYSVNLKDKILNRQPDALGLAKVVFRPDSGDPTKIICGYHVWDESVQGTIDLIEAQDMGCNALYRSGKYYEIDFEFSSDGWVDSLEIVRDLSEAEVKGSIQVLWETFGGTINAKGYKELNPRVGLIYGDSITLQRATEILSQLAQKGFAASNVVFGIGSFTYQMVSRDSLGMAIKATWVQVNGEEREIFKDPKTDNGTKKSAKGLVAVFKDGDNYVLKDRCTESEEQLGELVPIFQDGVLLNQTSLAEIRNLLLN